MARGEYRVLLQQIVAFAYPLRSLPVKVVVPEEGCPVTPIEGAVLRICALKLIQLTRAHVERLGRIARS